MNRIAAPRASRSAGGITSKPSFRKAQAPTLCPSRRRAVSHRMVAERAGDGQVGPEVDADQYGPRHLVRHLRALNRIARDQPGRQIVHQVGGERQDDAGAPGGSGASAAPHRAASALTIRISPVLSSASTSTNNPATSGSTAQEMPFSVAQGACARANRTTAAVRRPAIAVGRPSWMSSADEPSRTSAVAAMPSAAVFPPPDKRGNGHVGRDAPG